ncbi:DUF4307 domain-containing protein [Microbacterium sp.]|uniref:DUF4307 domain-containing protein n=1 Tax=Microbacterium sp. TaxID=51671 RepID=UPI002600FC77|nr:DUF4307 domain-containing protein [Microbacterium sp.]
MTTAATKELLDDRYGRRRGPGRRIGWIVLGLVAAAVVGSLAWTTVTSAIDTVDVNTTGFTVHDPHTVSIQFQITVRPGVPVACALEAQDTEHGVVGWRIVEYPASDEHSRAFDETVPTTAEATTGLAASCWIP